MKKTFLITGLLVSIATLIFGLWFVVQQAVPIEKQITNKIPQGAFLRDILKTDNGHLFIYIEPGYKIEPEVDFMSCPGEILGQPIIGKYHLALFRRGQILSDIAIPDTPYGIIWKKSGQAVPLLKLTDYTGDGQANEFLIKTTGGGCGFFESLVAGLDGNIVRVYSDWTSQFSPDSSGKSYDLFDCGNHGNIIKTETWYEFDKTTKFFKQTQQKSIPCGASVDFIKNFVIKNFNKNQNFTQNNIIWSKDKSIVAFTYIVSGKNPTAHLVLFENQSSKIIKDINLGTNQAFVPVVSPDGQYIAVQTDLVRKITIYDFAGNYITDLPIEAGKSGSLLDYKWSNDSKKILYRSQETERYYEVAL